MKLDYPKKYYEERIAREGDAEIGAGLPPAFHRRRQPEPLPSTSEIRIALGTFIELWRRNRGWNAEQLARRAGILPEAVLGIEHDPHHAPEPEVVQKLAGVLGIPPRPLLELAGLAESTTPNLHEAAVRFTAGSEPVAALNEHERKALDAFLAALSKMPGSTK
jgi:transcriptional regulator with XRE-family HTH domain